MNIKKFYCLGRIDIIGSTGKKTGYYFATDFPSLPRLLRHLWCGWFGAAEVFLEPGHNAAGDVHQEYGTACICLRSVAELFILPTLFDHQSKDGVYNMQAPHSYTEVAEFIADVNPAHVLKYKASKQASKRFEELAMKKKTGELTDDEQDELAMHIHIEYLMSLAKAKARAKVQNA